MRRVHRDRAQRVGTRQCWIAIDGADEIGRQVGSAVWVGRISGTRDTDLQRQEFVEGVDRPVAAIGDSGSGVAQAAERLHAGEAICAKVMFGLADRVRRALRPLVRHGRSDIECREARVVGRGDGFVVRNRGAIVGRWQLCTNVPHGIERLANCTLAGGVHMGVESGLDRLEQQGLHHLGRVVDVADIRSGNPVRRSVGTRVGVVRRQQGAIVCRSIDHPVHEHLDDAHTNTGRCADRALVIARGQCLRGGDGIGRTRRRICRRQVDGQVDACGQFARLLQSCEGFAVRITSRGVHEARDALLAECVQRGTSLCQQISIGVGRDRRLELERGFVLADAGRVVACIAQEGATGGIGRRCRDTGHGQAARVGPRGVEVR